MHLVRKGFSIIAVTLFIGLLAFPSLPAVQHGKGTLKGKVVNEKGKAIVGANIRIMDVRTRETLEIRTNDKGEFSLELEADEYTIGVDAEGYRGGSLRSMQQVEEGKVTKLKTITLEKDIPSSLIRGTVFDFEGRVIAGATVKLLRLLTPVELNAAKKPSAYRDFRITNGRGEFAFRVPSAQARYELTAIAEGYEKETRVVDVVESESVPVAFSMKQKGKGK